MLQQYGAADLSTGDSTSWQSAASDCDSPTAGVTVVGAVCPFVEILWLFVKNVVIIVKVNIKNFAGVLYSHRVIGHACSM